MRKSLELSIDDKLLIVSNLDLIPKHIDVSGGDPLISSDNIHVISRLSEKFGRERISITTTGSGLANVDLDVLSKYISGVDFTYDYPYELNQLRPHGYNSSNLNAIKYLPNLGLKTTALVLLYSLNSKESIIRKIYTNLSSVNVHEIYLMKYFYSGRGIGKNNMVMSDTEYKRTIALYQQIENSNGPKILLQTALKYRYEQIVSSNMNITNLGILLLNPWSYNRRGNPKPNVVLGDLKKQTLSALMS